MRLANVYGPYCTKVVGTMLCMARVYAYLNEEMKWLWTKDLRTHTVHVSDVSRALWQVAEWYAGGKKNWTESVGKTPVFNIVDDGDTSMHSGQTYHYSFIILTRTPKRPRFDARTHR
jgi:nucleoside-diphosphate-sugar epimerase